VDAKSNEIPAVRDLLRAFADLAGAVITIDALHTQHDTAKTILARHADYVMTVKAALAPAWVEFAGAAQVAQVRRTVTKSGDTSSSPPARSSAQSSCSSSRSLASCGWA